jgi:hypothetical protein
MEVEVLLAGGNAGVSDIHQRGGTRGSGRENRGLSKPISRTSNENLVLKSSFEVPGVGLSGRTARAAARFKIGRF